MPKRKREKQAKRTEAERPEVEREDNLNETGWARGLSPGVGVSARTPAKSSGPKSTLVCGYMPEATKSVSKSLYDKSVSTKHEGVSYRSSTPHSELFESQNSALLSRAQAWHQASHTADAQ